MLERPMRAPPGDRFAYDGLSADLLSVALSRAIRRGARMDARQFARRRLFDPLGIRDYAWSAQAEGSPRGETDLFLTPRDMARIGLLMLRGGRWGDRRIVSQGFVAEATSRRNPGGPPLGAAYGYLWWVTKTRAGLDAFFAAGSGGQLVYVVPALDLVVAVLAQAADGDSPDLVDMIASSAPAGAPCVDRLGSEPR
jgi:CubicO group peptidase (beta-lactamase class C family)